MENLDKYPTNDLKKDGLNTFLKNKESNIPMQTVFRHEENDGGGYTLVNYNQLGEYQNQKTIAMRVKANGDLSMLAEGKEALDIGKELTNNGVKSTINYGAHKIVYTGVFMKEMKESYSKANPSVVSDIDYGSVEIPVSTPVEKNDSQNKRTSKPDKPADKPGGK